MTQQTQSSSEATAQFIRARTALVSRTDQSGPARRQALTALTDDWLATLFESAGGEKYQAALIGVGGYGRRELAPGSDLDLLLIHDGDIGGLPEAIWYPVWDAKLSLDHSVRTLSEARRVAADDLKVVLGLLDARTIAGDDELRARLVASVLADWRGFAARRIPELREMVDDRIAREGELAYLLEPDVKEAYGGLRDLTVQRALAASWIADVSHDQAPAPRQLLLDVRDALHSIAVSRGSRVSDRLLMQEQDPVAERLGLADSLDMMRQVSAAGRTIGYASDAAWYRVLRQTTRVKRGPFRRRRSSREPERTPLANGVVEQGGEVVLAMDAKPSRDPVLVLRAAAAAAQAGYRLSPYAVTRLAEESAPMPDPWPRSARDALTALLGAGRPAVAVWEALDQVGLIERLIPLWTPIRSAPQRNAVHRFTVDRHLVETAVEAARYQRDVDRPDLLLVGALLHDIGKGRPDQDHSKLGMTLVAQIAPQLGFDPADSAVLIRLVQHHLLLPEVATRRDLEDPTTIEQVAEAVQDEETLDLLYALTRADAAATGPKAWSDWKATLVADLVAGVRRHLQGRPAPTAAPTQTYDGILAEPGVAVDIRQQSGGWEVAVAVEDRPGLLSLVAGTLALHRLDVRSARTDTVSGQALLLWTVEPTFGDPPDSPRLTADLRRALDGSLDLAAALAKREAAYRNPEALFDRPANRVDVVADASEHATVIEVRAYDRPGLLYRLTNALSGTGVEINKTMLESRGANVIDVFYVTYQGEPLDSERAQKVQEALASVLV